MKKGDPMVAFFVSKNGIDWHSCMSLIDECRYLLRFSMCFPLKLRHKIDRNFSPSWVFVQGYGNGIKCSDLSGWQGNTDAL